MAESTKDTPTDQVEKKPVDDKTKDKKDQEEELLLVERIQDTQTDLHRPALEQLRTLIRTSTSSMTSVPKPLKFLSPHYATLKDVYEHGRHLKAR
ncbi:unnamed protein product [Absidia cylindrospora]